MSSRINWGVVDRDAMSRGFDTANRLLEIAADKQAGRALAGGDRQSAYNAYAQRGFVKRAEEVQTQGLQNDRMEVGTANMGKQGQIYDQSIDTTANQEQLAFVQRSAQAIKQVLDKDGPEGAMAAFDQMTPVFKTRGIDDQKIAELRTQIAQNPQVAIDSILAKADRELMVLSSGAQAVDSVTGEVKADNPVEQRPHNVGANQTAIDPATGEVLARGIQTTSGPDRWRTLSSEEASSLGYQPGSVIQLNESTGEQRVREDAPSSRSSGNGEGGIKISPRAEATLEKIREEGSQIENTMSLMVEFKNLNEKVETGGVLAMPLAPEAAGAFNEGIARMNSITSRLTPAMRQGMPGAASDRDVAMFRDATVSVNKKREANLATYRMYEAASQRFRQRQEYLEAYALRHGTLVGSVEDWNKYKEDPKNDMFRRNEDGSVTVNKMSNWREYMRWDEQGQKSTAPSGLSNKSDDDLFSILGGN